MMSGSVAVTYLLDNDSANALHMLALSSESERRTGYRPSPAAPPGSGREATNSRNSVSSRFASVSSCRFGVSRIEDIRQTVSPDSSR